ncbi:ArsR/SmtB family transcription factor [Streptomonospora nanhaiensis]|uniref:ArsR/SmtB family transcription factor n=1 Tax=Streptomonospora nanhaiensis TaxID=1323731 RepID=UPI001FEBD817|nr:helix-turn-helix domain-containing protein [Streptomonospora nanhaiensis]
MHAHDNTPGRPPEGSDEQYGAAAEVLGLLADPTRLHLLRLLTTEQDVSTLTAQVEASRSSVSQHLGRLRLAGLVTSRREGRRMLYRITSDHLAALVEEALGYAYHAVHDIPHHRAAAPAPRRNGAERRGQPAPPTGGDAPARGGPTTGGTLAP